MHWRLFGLGSFLCEPAPRWVTTNKELATVKQNAWNSGACLRVCSKMCLNSCWGKTGETHQATSNQNAWASVQSTKSMRRIHHHGHQPKNNAGKQVTKKTKATAATTTDRVATKTTNDAHQTAQRTTWSSTATRKEDLPTRALTSTSPTNQLKLKASANVCAQVQHASQLCFATPRCFSALLKENSWKACSGPKTSFANEVPWKNQHQSSLPVLNTLCQEQDMWTFHGLLFSTGLKLDLLSFNTSQVFTTLRLSLPRSSHFVAGHTCITFTSHHATQSHSANNPSVQLLQHHIATTQLAMREGVRT